jgi:predicted ArsR family transcriptional regulator
MTREAQLLWTGVLAKIQGIATEESTGFTTENLSEAAGVDSVQAAKWLTKFVDWGYIRRGEFEVGGDPGRRPRRLYYILKRGLEKDVSDVKKSDVVRLMERIQALIDAHGEKAETRALKELIEEYWAVMEDQRKRLEKKS